MRMDLYIYGILTEIEVKLKGPSKPISATQADMSGPDFQQPQL